MKRRNSLTMRDVRDYVLHTYPDYLFTQIEVGKKPGGDYVIEITCFTKNYEFMHSREILGKTKMQLINNYIAYVQNERIGL